MSVQIVLGVNCIELRTNGWVVDLPDRCRRIEGARYNKRGEFWYFPLDIQNCKALREEFGSSMLVGNALSDWAKQEIARQKELEKLKLANEVSLPRIEAKFPKLDAALKTRPYQRAAVRYIAENRNVLLSDDPGLGKTIQSIAAVVEMNIGGPILIVAPSVSLRVVWLNEIARWTAYPAWVADGPRKNRESVIASFASDLDYNFPQFLVVNSDMARYKVWDKNKKQEVDPPDIMYPELFDIDWQAVIVDESQDALICTTANRRKQTQIRVGMAGLRGEHLNLAMSGTPGSGKLQNIWGTLNWLLPRKFTSFWKWADRHFEMDDNGFGIDVGDCKDPDVLYGELDQVMLRRLKIDVAPDLPPKVFNNIILPMTPEQSKAYKSIVKNGIAKVPGGTIIVNGALTEITRFRQIATMMGTMEGETFSPALPSNKYDWIVQFLAERGIQQDGFGNGKVVIASEFTGHLREIERALRTSGVIVAVLTGDTPTAMREDIIQDFQDPDNDLRVLLINKIAAGTAITLDIADDMILLERHWNPDRDKQVEDRIHRVSRNHTTNFWYLASEGTYEQAIAALAEEKSNQLSGTLDESRMADLMRILLEQGEDSFREKVYE